ncbi:MAG: ABC transporter ATP-binding protein/permease [Bacilli bacterium]|nr:ABC transporter ATP-binding protein/permease [Bacilli bacterium]
MIKLFKRFLGKYKFHVIFGSLFKVLEAFFELIVPLVIKYMLDKIVNNNVLAEGEKIRQLWICGGILFTFAILGFTVTIIAQYIASRASQGFGTDLRNDLYNHINTLSFKEIDKISSASLINRLQSDTVNVQSCVAMIIRLVLRAPMIVIGSMIMSFIVNWKAGLIFLATTIILSTFIFLLMFRIIPISKKSQAKLDVVTKISKENLSGNRVVRAFNKQKYEYTRFVDNQVSLCKIQSRLATIEAFLNPMVFFIINLASVVVLYVSGLQFVNNEISVGDIQALINYFTQIQLAVVAVLTFVVLLTKGAASGQRINEVYDLKSSIKYGEINSINDIDEVISFNHVTFRYNENANAALKDITFSIKKGEHIGIIGGTGSGKTSLINLINRFYDVSDGEITLFGHNVKHYCKQTLSNSIATVMQKAVLFNTSIKENIRKGKRDASDEEITKALKSAQAFDFVSKLDNGINYLIQENAKNLSGGQRQRLSIARALIKDSPILILDDSSSALDYMTEANLKKEIKKLNKTVITISQRASSVIDMDRIILLEKGELIATGTHNELLKNSKLYQEICASQDLGERHV